MAYKVSFQGDNRRIVVHLGQTNLDVKSDIYSEWKEWSILEDNSKYPEAISVIGGEAIGGGQFIGATYFLENGWRIKPWEGDHNLEVNGNIYTREEGQTPFVNTDGAWKINIINKVSTVVSTVETSNVSIPSSIDAQAIAQALWEYSITGSLPVNSLGDHIFRKLLTLGQYMATK
jgi:hypothetical protein